MLYIRKKEENNHLVELTKSLADLEANILPSPDNTYLSQINTIKYEIEEIYNKKAIGCIIHSRCKFIDEYEKPSKYFLNVEKVVQKVKHIRCLVVDGKRIFNPTEILKSQSNFYTKLILC